MSEEQEQLRERQELISALRNFAEHFGAAEVYEQAKAIYQESSAGRAAREHEAASFDSVLRDSSRPVCDRQKPSASGRRASRGSPALEDAKKLLGG